MRFFSILRPRKDKDFFIRVFRWFFPGNCIFGFFLELFFIFPLYKRFSIFSQSAVTFSNFYFLVR